MICHGILSKIFVVDISSVHWYPALPFIPSRQHFSAPWQVCELCDYIWLMECEQSMCVIVRYGYLVSLLSCHEDQWCWIVPDDEAIEPWTFEDHMEDSVLKSYWGP